MSRNVRHLLPALATLFLTGALLSACKPWTIVPLDNATREGRTSSARLDPRTFVDSIWASRVLPEAKTSALELRDALAAGSQGSSPLFVRGEGVVMRVDRSSRVGLALVDLAPGDGRADVALQIGPVIRGMALRDTLSFVRFSDFANQLEFAEVGNALNARVTDSVLDGIAPSPLEGQRVTFWGATHLGAAGGGRVPEVVPVVLEREGQ